MASRSSTTFQKRQRELKRLEKRRDKDERKEVRKKHKGNGGEGPPIEAIDPTDLGLPELAEEEEEQQPA